MLQVYNYNAGKGDCIRLRYTGKSGRFRNVIIDAGESRFGLRFASIISEISKANEQVDILILTHADEDHIGGLLNNLRQNIKLPITEVWMNHGNLISKHVDLSIKQNDEVYTRLKKVDIPVKPAVAGVTYELDGASFHILWPAEKILNNLFKIQNPTPLGMRSDYGYSFEELMDMPIKYADTSPNNHASIAFEFVYDGVRFLFTGDAWAEDILANIENGKYDLVKLPHHGSVRNISGNWKSKIDCSNYMICTDGIYHPDKQTIAKLIKWYGEINVYASAAWWHKFLMEKDLQYNVHFMEDEETVWETRMRS